MAKHDIVIRVEGEKDLATVIGAVFGTGIVISTTLVPETVERKKSQRYINGKRNKGIQGRDLVLQLFRSRPGCVITKTEFEGEFVKHGFAKSSVSPVISELGKEGRVIYTSEGHYMLFSPESPSK